MGSPLGRFYLGHFENIILQYPNIKPSTYARYVDDIFLEVTSEDQINTLKEAFENITLLKFTYEMITNNKLPFLDVLLINSGGTIRTKFIEKRLIKNYV